MVFAVFAAPEPVAPGMAALEDALVDSVRRARAEPEQLAYEASERYGYPAGFLARYFEKLRYRFGPRERAGLFTFLEMAEEVGELERVPEMRFVGRGGAGVTPDGAGRGADRGASDGAAGGGAEGGPAAHRDRVRRRCALRQPRRRRQAEVVLHLLVRPEAARRARRGGDAPAAGGDRADRRARTGCGGRSSRCASTRRRRTASRRAAWSSRDASSPTSSSRRCRRTTATSSRTARR